MPDLTNTYDQGSFSFFLNLLAKNVSNIPNQIKKCGNYAESYGFKESIGVEMLTVALETFKVECDVEGITFPKTKTELWNSCLSF